MSVTYKSTSTSKRGERGTAVDPEALTIIERLWRALIESDIETPEADELLRQLFLGTALPVEAAK